VAETFDVIDIIIGNSLIRDVIAGCPDRTPNGWLTAIAVIKLRDVIDIIP